MASPGCPVLGNLENWADSVLENENNKASREMVGAALIAKLPVRRVTAKAAPTELKLKIMPED